MLSVDTLMYNPENPYVFNENYFENTSHIIYKETVSYIIFRASFAFSAILSLCLIGLILRCILVASPEALRPFSKMLFICALVDVYVIVIDFLCQMVTF
jgi:hypothetical protein